MPRHFVLLFDFDFLLPKNAKIKNSVITKYLYSFKRLNNTADICEHVSHSLRHSLQRMKLHHSRMLQDLSRKQEALSLEHRSMNTRGRLTTTSSANKSLVPLAPLTNSGGKSNLQLLAEWILTAECFGLHCTKLIFGFLFMNVCQGEMSLKIPPSLHSCVCLIVFQTVLWLLPLAPPTPLNIFSTKFCSKCVEDDYLPVLTFTRVVRSLLLSAISFNGFVWPRHNIWSTDALWAWGEIMMWTLYHEVSAFR